MSLSHFFSTDVELCRILKRGISRIHFIGILGAGMLPLAKLARSLGYTVIGSDIRAESELLRDGICIRPHSADNVSTAELIVASLAVGADNPEICEAARLSLPIVSRAQLLGAFMLRYSTRIGISGSHGKSTTTALIDKVFCDAGIAPTTVSGATLYDGGDFRSGERSAFIYEACEYKDAFLHFIPTVQVITSIELDHTDYFDSIDSLTDSFRRSAEGAETVVLNSDFKGSADFRASLGTRALTYGNSETADYRYLVIDKSREGCRFCILKHGNLLLETCTSLMGEYNLANLTAAVAVSDNFGIDAEIISSSISDFSGIERRMSRLPSLFGFDIYYDYAHHPTEISHAIDALKARYGACTVVFRPHTYTRTKSLWQDFMRALSKADFTILLDIYPAREKPIEGITSQNLAKAIGKSCIYAQFDEVLPTIRERATSPVVFMGAGDFSRIFRLFDRG